MKLFAFALLFLASTASPVLAAGITLTIQNGLVSLDAQDVTVRQILMEWARVGKTRVVNVERVAGGPVTLKFEQVPERQALDIVLRGIPGYIAAPREMLVADGSIYDRILLMPTTTAVAALKQPPQPSANFSPGFPGGSSFTQLRPSAPQPGTTEPNDPALDQISDPALAAAAAAGLIPAPGAILTPAPMPGNPTIPMQMMMPPNSPNAPAQPAQTPPAPTNPWNAPAGTAQPSLAAPQPVAPTTVPPLMRPRPPQADQ
jgi:hypothetical protein